MAHSLYVPDPTAQGTLVQPWDEAFRVRTTRVAYSILAGFAARWCWWLIASSYSGGGAQGGTTSTTTHISANT